MNLSKRWLNDYVTLGVTDKEFADLMTMSGSKVEAVNVEGENLTNIVVGQLLELKKHPDSDHLWVCQVYTGNSQTLSIVTGAQNCRVKDYVPVALDNAIINGGKIIKKGAVRGIDSEGMLCSLSELGLTKHDFPYAVEDGIFILGDDCERVPGMDIRESIGLNDIITEFEITSNRPDCLSVIGLAREAAATIGQRFVVPTPETVEAKDKLEDLLDVEIFDDGKCYRYVGAVVKDVKIAPSPRWMRERLRASGVRPINNIVDITNYVMLEFGQPMHAFDIRFLEGNKVNVRCAENEERIVTLDGVERILEKDMLVIADAVKPVAVAGIMGGEFSGIMEDTKTIVFESACFNGASVRSTAKKLGMRTESSARFEKELDPNGCLLSLERALELVKILNAGTVINEVVDCNRSVKKPRVINFDPEWINRFIGINLSRTDQKAMLENLNFIVDSNTVTVPTFRNDVEHPADLAEEVARFYGYENIPNLPLTGVANGKLSDKQKYEALVNATMLACGFSEIQTYSFVGLKCFDKICLPVQCDERNCVRIANPLGEDTGIMRTTTLPSMLEVLARNFNFRNSSAKLYEIATEYLPRGNDKLPEEKQSVMLGMYGDGANFLTAKGVVEELLAVTGIRNYSVEAETENPSYHAGRCARIFKENSTIAIVGEVHPNVIANYDITTNVYAAEIDFETLYSNRETKKAYVPLPKYPSIDRDLSFVCDKSIPVLKLRDLIATAVGDLLDSITLFDVYDGEQIPRGKKSVAFSITLRSAERTLTDRDADEAMSRAVQSLNAQEISLRS